jgi:hypothetical protein
MSVQSMHQRIADFPAAHDSKATEPLEFLKAAGRLRRAGRHFPAPQQHKPNTHQQTKGHIMPTGATMTAGGTAQSTNGRGNKKATADQLAFGTGVAHRARLAGLVDLPRAGE